MPLSAALLRAGFAGVISSLWPVSDLSTAILMERFYRLWREEGLAPAHALRQAQQWLRDATTAELGLADRHERLFQASGRRDRQAFRAMRLYKAYPDDKPFAHPY